MHLYGELSDVARIELEQHLDRCGDCKREWETAKAFRAEMDTFQPAEPSAYLLASSRIKLHDALENVQPAWSWRRFVLDPVHWLQQMRFSPALAAAILIVGFTAGVLTTFQITRPGATGQKGIIGGVTPPPPTIAGISGIEQQPGTDRVQIKYDTVQQQQTQGSLEDPKIEQLLLYAARNQQNPGVRVSSLDLLSQRCKDPQVREQMIYSLRYDKNPGVQLKAVDALQPYVKSDLRVRDALIEALLLPGTNQGVRTEAIRLLQAVKADTSVRAALKQLNKDPNPFIQRESKRMLASMANIE